MPKRSRLRRTWLTSDEMYWAKRLKVRGDTLFDTKENVKLTQAPDSGYLIRRRQALIVDPSERELYGLKRLVKK